MSNKALCPACDSYTSDVYRAFVIDGATCPNCGLPADTYHEIERIRRSRADTELTERLEAALIRAGKAETEAGRLRQRLARIEAVVAGELDGEG